jgi:hypothetical protein
VGQWYGTDDIVYVQPTWTVWYLFRAVAHSAQILLLNVERLPALNLLRRELDRVEPRRVFALDDFFTALPTQSCDTSAAFLCGDRKAISPLTFEHFAEVTVTSFGQHTKLESGERWLLTA